MYLIKNITGIIINYCCPFDWNFVIVPHLSPHSQVSYANERKCAVTDEVKCVSPLFKPPGWQLCSRLLGPCWNPSGSKKTKTQPCFAVLDAINKAQRHVFKRQTLTGNRCLNKNPEIYLSVLHSGLNPNCLKDSFRSLCTWMSEG